MGQAPSGNVERTDFRQPNTKLARLRLSIKEYANLNQRHNYERER